MNLNVPGRMVCVFQTIHILNDYFKCIVYNPPLDLMLCESGEH